MQQRPTSLFNYLFYLICILSFIYFSLGRSLWVSNFKSRSGHKSVGTCGDSFIFIPHTPAPAIYSLLVHISDERQTDTSLVCSKLYLFYLSLFSCTTSSLWPSLHIGASRAARRMTKIFHSMTKNVYNGIFHNYTGFTIYVGINFFHAWAGVNHIFYWLMAVSHCTCKQCVFFWRLC